MANNADSSGEGAPLAGDAGKVDDGVEYASAKVVDGPEGGDPTQGLPAETSQELDSFPGYGTPPDVASKEPLWQRALWEGGSPADVFLTAASAQVGQVILNLPNSMAKLGLVGGILTQVSCATTAVYTLWLLQSLYHENKRKQVKEGTWYAPGTFRRDHVTQYHQVIYAVTGSRWFAEFSRVVNVLELMGLACAQIISAASNFYYLEPESKDLGKRDFTFIFGAVATCFVLLPTFRNVRLFVIIALVGSTYVSWYMMAESIKNGFDEAAWAASYQPTSIADIFQAVSNILFTFGGHCMLMEVLDSQFRPSKFRGMFGWALLYVTATLTLPNSIMVYLSFPQEAYDTGNAFKIFPRSPAMAFGIVIMMLHQMVAYGLFMLPVFIMTEKLFKVHEKDAYWLKVAVRLIPALFIWFIALLLPFFGVINDLIGAFCVPFETYITPCVAFTMYYWSKERQATAVDSYHGVPYKVLFVINAFIIVAAAVGGLGFGGYASVTELIDSVQNFGVFAPCYQC